MTCHVFSRCHLKLFKTKSFHWCQIIHGRPLLKMNQMRLNGLSVVHKSWVKGTWHHRKGFIHANILFGGKELPTNVDHVLPPLLSQWTTKEPMFQWIHHRRATMRATLVNLCWYFTMPFINRDSLVSDRPGESRLFCALALCQIIFHSGEVEGGISFVHLCKIGVLRVVYLLIHFLPSLAQ